MAKWKDDLADVQAIYEDVVRFSRMTFEQWKSHLDAHPEDRGLYHINLPDGGHLFIGAAATDRFAALTKRLISAISVNGDLHRSTVNDAIRASFVEMVRTLNGTIDRSAVDKMLSRALKAAKRKHRATTHYLPCTLVDDVEPREFRVGPVRFLHETKFFEYLGAAIEDDHRAASRSRRAKAEEKLTAGEIPELMTHAEWEELDRKLLEEIPAYYQAYGWVAEVSVPPCDGRISRVRAEIAAQAALDVLKLFAFDWYDARWLRLGVHHGIRDKVVEVVRRDDGHFDITWSQGVHDAAAHHGWFREMEEAMAGHLSAAGQVIETCLVAERPYDLATRWLDALNWYGQAVEERIPSVQVVKYVAALERLTITEMTRTDADRGLTDAVTRRAALFAAATEDAARDRRRLEARELYRLRSKLMHGQKSPVSKEQPATDEYRSLMATADDLTRHVLIGALGVYVRLVMDGKHTDADLEAHLRDLEVGHMQ